jgi:hypothetical protein
MAAIKNEEYKAKRAQFTKIPHDELIAVAKECGCKLVDKAGWVRVEVEGAKARFYIPKNKEVRRIDIAEALVTGREDEIVDLGGESFGRVKQMVRFDRSKDEVIATLRALFTSAATLELQPARVRAKPVALPGSAPAAGGAVEVKSELSVAQQIDALVAKKQKLIDTAAAMNAKVSEKRLANIDAKIAELQAKAAEAPAAQ